MGARLLANRVRTPKLSSALPFPLHLPNSGVFHEDLRRFYISHGRYRLPLGTVQLDNWMGRS